MKINKVTKDLIQETANERAQLEKLYHQKNQELINLVKVTSGEEGFIGFEIKEDELLLKFPIKEAIKKLTKGKPKTKK